jgi:hypothetical protein
MFGSGVRLGVIEGGRVVRNPLLWLSMVPAVLWAAWADTPVDEHFLLSGYGLVLGWFAVMAITALAVRRSRGGAVGEALDPLPGGPGARTLGVGFGEIGAGLAGLVLTIVVWVMRAPGAVLGNTTDTIPRGLPVPRPNLAQFAQGPLVLVVFASVGLLIGRWVPGWLLVPALFVPVVFQFLWFGVWNSQGTPWFMWLLPMATGWVAHSWVGDCSGGAGSACDLELSGFDRVTPWWHMPYLVALAALLVSIAVALDGERAARRWVVVTAIVTVALGVVQVLTYERWQP